MKNKIMSWDSYCKRLRKFKQYKELPDIEFLKRAKKLYQSKYKSVKEEVNISDSVENEIGVWINSEEAKEAEKLYADYISRNSIQNFSDLALLKSLVFYEIQQKRIYRIINDESKKAIEKETIYHPDKQISTLNEINVQVLNLKKVLGLCEEKKGQDPLEYINKFKAKCFAWAKEIYQQHRFRLCPHCGKELMLFMRPEVWETYKHPFFADKVLTNQHLWDMYKSGKIDEWDVARVLFGKQVRTTLYVSWLEKKIYGIKENKDPLLESGHEELKESGY